MPFQAVGGMSGVADGMLQREDEQPIGTQRARAGCNDVGQVTEIDQRVRRHDQVEGFAVIAQILGQLRLDQRVVDVLLGCLLEHSLRQVHAGERSCKRRDERAAQPGPASRVEHVETVRRFQAAVLKHRGDQRGRAVGQLRELRFKARREAVEGCLNEPVRCTLRHALSGTGRQHVTRDRVVRLLGEPFLEDAHRRIDFAQRAMRHREQLACVAMLRPQRNDFRVARRGFLRTLQRVQQDAEVGPGVDVGGIELERRTVGGFGLLRLSAGAQQDAEIVVRIRVARVDRDRAAIGVDRLAKPCGRLQHDAEIAVPVGFVGLKREASLDQRKGLVVSLLLMREQAGIVQCARVVGRGLEHAAVDLVRRCVFLVLLQQDRDRDRLFERQLARGLCRFQGPLGRAAHERAG